MERFPAHQFKRTTAAVKDQGVIGKHPNNHT